MSTMNKGRLFGFIFGLIGLMTAALMVHFYGLNVVELLDGKSEISNLVLLTFFFFTVLFGSICAIRIEKKGKNHLVEGALSSVYTIGSTVIASNLILFFVIGDAADFHLSGFSAIILSTLIYTLFIGGIPAVVLGMIFGFVMKKQIDKSSKEKR